MGEARDYYGDTGDSWSWLGEDEPDDYLSDEEIDDLMDQVYDDYFVYVLWTPSTFQAKVGLTKDRKNLDLRMQERKRQCGETILGCVFLPEETSFKSCKEKETQVINWFKSHPFIFQVSKEVFQVEDTSWLDYLENIEGYASRDEYPSIDWHFYHYCF